MPGESRELRRLETLSRNDGREELRLSFDEFTADNGKSSKYISVRKWYRTDAGEWRPTKAGVTVRLVELDRVVEALQRMQRSRDGKSGAPSNEGRPAKTEQRRPAEHRERKAGATDEELEQDGRLF